MADYISERTAGQVIGDSIRIYSKNLPIIFAIYALPLIPFMVLKALTTANQNVETEIIAALIEMVVSIFTLGAVTIAVSDVCLGNAPALGRSYSAMGRVFGKYLGTYFIYMLAVILGMIALVVPGLIAAVFLLFCLPITVIERRGPIEAIRRSVALGKDFYWRNAGVLLLAILVAVLLMFLIAIVVGTVLGVAGASPTGFAFSIIIAILTSLAAPLFQVPAILLYYDMRVRKENFDGASLAQELMT